MTYYDACPFTEASKVSDRERNCVIPATEFRYTRFIRGRLYEGFKGEMNLWINQLPDFIHNYDLTGKITTQNRLWRAIVPASSCPDISRQSL